MKLTHEAKVLLRAARRVSARNGQTGTVREINQILKSDSKEVSQG